MKVKKKLTQVYLQVHVIRTLLVSIVKEASPA